MSLNGKQIENGINVPSRACNTVIRAVTGYTYRKDILFFYYKE